jgi:ParB family chromosome partitioning protein
MAEKRRGLGRGLGALISSSPMAEETPDVASPANKSSSVEGSTDGTGRNGKVSRETPVVPNNDDTADPKDRNPQTATAPATPRDSVTLPRLPSEALPQTAPDAMSQGRVSTPDSSSKQDTARKSPGKAATPGSRKSRPVDMFFTSCSSEPVDHEEASASAAAGKTKGRAASARARRAEMPDVIGAVRRRDVTTPSAEGTTVAPVASLRVGDAAVNGEEGVGDIDVSRETLVDVPGATFAEISTQDIHPNRKQPRSVFDEEDMAELVHSIREVGLLQPIVVRPSEEDGHRYELVMGERRWRAVQQAGLDTIPAIIRETSNVDLLRDALLENLHRSQLNPLEEAAAYQQLMQEFSCTQEELSARIGRSRPQISNTIRLMKLPALVQRRVAAGVLSAGHARALLALGDPADMERIAQKIVNEGLSVRATEEIVALSDGLRRPNRETPPRSTARHERLDYLANSLSDRLDTNVKITLGAKKGRVSIEFASVDDLNRIMGVISPEAKS